MPNIKGAGKRMRTSEKSRQRNVAAKTRIRNIRRTVLEDHAGGADLQAAFRKYCSALDKAAKRGIISKNTAVRRKRRASARLRAASAAPATPAAAPAAPAV